MTKDKACAGADERTPSKAEYFSWISSTNEGSTEAQTLANLDYFRYLADAYGVKLDIYALDAGNLDGSSGTYETLDSPKLKKQYPEGYGNIVRKAAQQGTRFGVWCGPDGFGDTAQSAARRRELLVSLCRDHHFALLKCDAVCGVLSPERQKLFIDTLIECRKYSPDLILLNHRLELGDGMKYATTFLWEGEETYTDTLIANHVTAPHHRAYMFRRGNTPELKRLAEDHGVCLSSCMDYFEDELVLQAFGRSLLLAPEIYGNPWLLRDDEQPVLARVFNLHRLYHDILIDGMLLPPEKYGEHAVARGNGEHRFLVTGNASWERRAITVTLNEEIGLAPCDEVFVCRHFPYEEVVGVFQYGDSVSLTLEPFRACLLHVCTRANAPHMLAGCRYRVLHETNGQPDVVDVLSDSTMLRAPQLLGETSACPVTNDAETLFEATQFAACNDALELQSLRRAGETQIPEVRRAREAFFAQDTFRFRGCDTAALFDGDPDTYLDSCHRHSANETFHIAGGCLRVDFDRIYYADAVRITYFEAENAPAILANQSVPREGTYSEDLTHWSLCRAGEPEVVRLCPQAPVVMPRVHDVRFFAGRRMRVDYAVGGCLRYLRVPRPMNRLFSVELMRGCVPIALDASPKANNLMPPYEARRTLAMQRLSLRVSREQWRPGCYLAIALDGTHGEEGAYAAVKADGRFLGCPDRAVSYPVNAWECGSRGEKANYTYYLPVDESITDTALDVYVLFSDPAHSAFPCRVYLCDSKTREQGEMIRLTEEIKS